MKLKRQLPLLLLLTTLIGITGCLPKLDDTEEVITWNHFATGFVEKPAIYASQNRQTDVIFLYSTISGKEDKNFVFILNEDQRNRVAEHAKQFGDKLKSPATYRGLVRNGGAVVPLNIYYTSPISTVEVSSSVDWGEELPAGSSLNSQFAYFTGCSDKFAKTQEKYDKQSAPEEFPSQNQYYQQILRENFAQQPGTSEIMYGMLSDLDLTGKDYVGISTIVMVLTSDHKDYRKPQDLTIKVTFRSGETSSVVLPLNKPYNNK